MRGAARPGRGQAPSLRAGQRAFPRRRRRKGRQSPVRGATSLQAPRAAVSVSKRIRLFVDVLPTRVRVLLWALRVRGVWFQGVLASLYTSLCARRSRNVTPRRQDHDEINEWRPQKHDDYEPEPSLQDVPGPCFRIQEAGMMNARVTVLGTHGSLRFLDW